MSRIAGPGGPFDRDQVVVDTRGAVLLDGTNVAVVGAIRKERLDEVVLAMELEGRVNKTQDRSSTLYLFDVDGAAAIISELMGMASRLGTEFAELLIARIDALPKPD